MAISTEVKEQICSLYIGNNSIKKIHKIVGVSEPTISGILKSAGITIRKSNYQKANLDSDEVNRLYESGLSTYDLAKRFEVSNETIRKLIKNVRSASERTHTNSTKIKIANKSKQNWQDLSYQEKVRKGKTKQYYETLSAIGKQNYPKTLGKWINQEESRSVISEIVKLRWQDPKYRQQQEVYFQERGARLAAASKQALKEPTKRKSWINKIRENNANRQDGGWVSTTQKQLYYILEESGIDFLQEGSDTKISPFYVVDCIIPLQQSMKKPLIIEVNGEYWHSLPHVTLKDRQKATYIDRHTEYDLLTLEELEMNNYAQVQDKLASFGLKLKETSCEVVDLEIKQIAEVEAQMFYSIFHYSSSVRKGATTFGAFFQGQLVGAVSYTYPLRRSSANRLDLELKELIEISRLARTTNLVCKNFLSWFISKTMRQLPKSIKCVISFSDSTYNHTGGVYKAANFINDGEIQPDYSYIAATGQYHKKTIWDRSKRMKMTENEYAEKHNLLKVYGGPKTRWLFWRFKKK